MRVSTTGSPVFSLHSRRRFIYEAKFFIARNSENARAQAEHTMGRGGACSEDPSFPFFTFSECTAGKNFPIGLERPFGIYLLPSCILNLSVNGNLSLVNKTHMLASSPFLPLHARVLESSPYK